jgi:hypothetical protein
VGLVNPADPDIQYRGKNAKPIPPDYEPGELGPSEWWFQFWRDIRTRDQELAARLSRPKGAT